MRVEVGPAEPGKVLQAAGDPRRFQPVEYRFGHRRDSFRRRSKGAIADRVDPRAVVEIDDRVEVDVEPERGERAPDRGPDRLHTPRAPVGLDPARRQAVEQRFDLAQPVDPPPLLVHRHEQGHPPGFPQADDQVRRLARRTQVAGEEDDAGRTQFLQRSRLFRRKFRPREGGDDESPGGLVDEDGVGIAHHAIVRSRGGRVNAPRTGREDPGPRTIMPLGIISVSRCFATLSVFCSAT